MRASAGQTGEPPRGETIPYAVGTSARITDSVRMEDGRYYLVALGVRRFRIQSVAQRQPYLVAAVAYLEDARPAAAAAERLRALYARYWEALGAATGQHYEADPLPDDPLELSYALAHRLQLDNARKQRWLEADARTRIGEIAAALRAELALLPAAGPAHGGGGGPWSWN
jgi:Lon protease-like protein